MERVAPSDQVEAARALRALIAAHESKRDLIAMGAYAKGSDPRVDQALQRWLQILQFLQQDARQATPLGETTQELKALVRGLNS
jgi:flagellum-specific ATP synthase